jgi:hypothetical protein
MKHIILASLLIFAMSMTYAEETKKVCIEQKDSKTGKTKQVCKQVKQHKKLEVSEKK